MASPATGQRHHHCTHDDQGQADSDGSSDIGTGLLESSDLIVEALIAFGKFNNEALALVIFGECSGLAGLEFGGIHLVVTGVWIVVILLLSTSS